METEFLIELLIYLIFGLGSILLMWDSVDLAIMRFKLRHRLRALKTEQKKLPRPLEYLKSLLDASFKNSSGKRFFVLGEIMLFIVSYVLGFRNFGAAFSAGIAFVTVAMPVLILAARLESTRSKSSREGISLVTELNRQYRINKLNIYEAIEKAAAVDGNYKISSERLNRLLIRMRSSCGPIELRDAIDNFVFSFGTNWARMLGICIRVSAENGTDVSDALADIADQLNDANSLEEKRRMMNSEASRMTLLLVPLMYAGCMGAAVFYLGVSPASLIRNQFLNAKAYLMLLLIIFLFLVNILLLYFSGNNKLDY